MLYNIIRYSSNSDVIVLWYNYVTKYYININECNNNNIVHRDWLKMSNYMELLNITLEQKFNCVIKAGIHFPLRKSPPQGRPDAETGSLLLYFQVEASSGHADVWLAQVELVGRAIEQRWHRGTCRKRCKLGFNIRDVPLLSLQNHKNITLSAVSQRRIYMISLI